MTHIYVAGPMRGIPEFNFDAFDRVAAELRLDGWVVHSPAEWDREQGFSEVGCTGFESLAELASFSHRASMGAAVAFICERADAIYMLAGWEGSSGARAEHALAVCLGLEVLYEASV